MPARHELVSDLNITVGRTLEVENEGVLVPVDVVHFTAQGHSRL